MTLLASSYNLHTYTTHMNTHHTKLHTLPIHIHSPPGRSSLSAVFKTLSEHDVIHSIFYLGPTFVTVSFITTLILFVTLTFFCRPEGSATDGHYNLTSPWIHVGPCDMWVTNWDLWMSNLHIVCTGYPESYMFIIACLIPRLTSVIFAHEHMYCTRCLYQFPERFANDVPNCIVTYMYMLAYH